MSAFESTVAAAVQKGMSGAIVRGDMRPLYLYFREGEGKNPGGFLLTHEAEAPWELVTGERAPAWRGTDTVKAWALRLARLVPVLAPDLDGRDLDPENPEGWTSDDRPDDQRPTKPRAGPTP